MAATRALNGTQPTGPMGVQFSTGQPTRLWSTDQWGAMEADRAKRHAAEVASHNRLVNVGRVASAVPLAFAAAPLFAGGAAAGGAGAASVPGAVGASAAPLGVGSVAGAAGGGMTLGNIFNLANLGVGAFSSFMGQRSQNKGLDQQMALQRQQMAMQAQADAEARAEAKRQFDATQANESRRYAADDEERAFQRRLVEEREARLAPYRAQADRARQRLARFLGLG